LLPHLIGEADALVSARAAEREYREGLAQAADRERAQAAQRDAEAQARLDRLEAGERARLEGLVRAERGWPEGEDTPLRRAVLPGLIAAKAAAGSQCA
jgi:hypothetical protein